MQCCYHKANGEQCRRAALRGHMFCYHHIPKKRLCRWLWHEKKGLLIFGLVGSIASIIGLILTIFPIHKAKDIPDLIFQRLAEEKIHYHEEEIKQLSTYDQIVEVLINDLEENQSVTIYKVGIREGIDSFVRFSAPDKDTPNYAMNKIKIFRDRSEANMEPAIVEVAENVGDAYYLKIFQGYESAIITEDVQGSAGILSLRILIRSGNDYIDLLSGHTYLPGRTYPTTESVTDILVQEFVDANHTFADLDGDGWKELIIVEGCKGHKTEEPTIRIFTAKKDNLPLFFEVDPNSPRYEEFVDRLAEIKEGRRLWPPGADDCESPAKPRKIAPPMLRK